MNHVVSGSACVVVLPAHRSPHSRTLWVCALPAVWHGSGVNTSTDKQRMALAVHAVPADTRFSPHRKAGYIYGRYKLGDSLELHPSFFPVCYQTKQQQQ